jgi:two-component system, sensor histidine kinase and response regulator
MTRILMIEDETILREEVVEWLTLEGYEALGAADGVDGINEVFRAKPDLIVCDITMPRLDGYGVLLELRANPDTAAVPIIFVTARASHDDIRQGMALGADDYITKPFSRLELLKAVEARLGKMKMQELRYQAEIEQWQKAFEQEREQRLFKAKLVAMFSHDFRNPLSTIMSSNSLLRDFSERMDEDRRKKHQNRIEASVRQLMQMIDDMLIISQMETGNLEFNSEPLQLEEFLQRIIEEFQVIHAETHRLTFDSQFSDPVIADPRLLRQIAANLISNAIKYSPQGSEVKVSLKHQDGQFILTVRD